ncbi:MAG: hypothetical protein JW893_01975 [Candidatus Omnitrophica bacterium]|nr:hypothetical protein [Candidatus Omnitrophota bacterium]
MQERSTLIKSVALIVVMTFFVTNHLSLPVYASGNLLPLADKKLEKSIPFEISKIEIPEKIGEVLERYQGQNDQTVVLIQDAHAIPEAQLNIQRLIGYFQETYGVDLIALEGAASRLDPQILRSFPDQELLKKVLNDYHEKGELTGSTAAAILNHVEGQYEGIENWDLYEQGLAYFLQAAGKEEDFLRRISIAEKGLQEEKQNTYPEELLAIDRLLQDFGENLETFITVLKKLSNYQKLAKGSELDLILGEYENQFVDRVHLDREVMALAEKVEDFLHQGDSTNGGREDLKRFHKKRQAFQISQITPEAFALFMKELIEEKGISLEVSNTLKPLMQNQLRMKDLRGTRLFKEFQAYTESVKEKFYRTDLERDLNRRGLHLDLLTRLAKLNIGYEDWKRIETIIQGQEFEEIPLGQDDLKHHIAFYQTAEARDQAFYQNLIQKMQSSSSRDTLYSSHSSSVLIAGGFHTEGLTERFRQEGISYVLVMPRISSVPDETSYRQNMRGEVAWKGYFRVENDRINIYKAFIRSTRDKLVEESGEDPGTLLKHWRDQIVRDLAGQKRLDQAGKYTLFIDEILDEESIQKLRQKWLQNIERFIQGIRDLDAQGDLTEQNILNLLQTATTSDGFTYPVLAAGDAINLSKLPAGVLPHLGVERRLVSEGVVPSGLQGIPVQIDTLDQVPGRSELRSMTSQQMARHLARALSSSRLALDATMSFSRQNLSDPLILQMLQGMFEPHLTRVLDALSVFDQLLGEPPVPVHESEIPLIEGFEGLIMCLETLSRGSRMPLGATSAALKAKMEIIGSYAAKLRSRVLSLRILQFQKQGFMSVDKGASAIDLSQTESRRAFVVNGLETMKIIGEELTLADKAIGEKIIMDEEARQYQKELTETRLHGVIQSIVLVMNLLWDGIQGDVVDAGALYWFLRRLSGKISQFNLALSDLTKMSFYQREPAFEEKIAILDNVRGVLDLWLEQIKAVANIGDDKPIEKSVIQEAVTRLPSKQAIQEMDMPDLLFAIYRMVQLSELMMPYLDSKDPAEVKQLEQTLRNLMVEARMRESVLVSGRSELRQSLINDYFLALINADVAIDRLQRVLEQELTEGAAIAERIDQLNGALLPDVLVQLRVLGTHLEGDVRDDDVRELTSLQRLQINLVQVTNILGGSIYAMNPNVDAAVIEIQSIEERLQGRIQAAMELSRNEIEEQTESLIFGFNPEMWVQDTLERIAEWETWPDAKLYERRISIKRAGKTLQWLDILPKALDAIHRLNPLQARVLIYEGKLRRGEVEAVSADTRSELRAEIQDLLANAKNKGIDVKARQDALRELTGRGLALSQSGMDALQVMNDLRDLVGDGTAMPLIRVSAANTLLMLMNYSLASDNEALRAQALDYSWSVEVLGKLSGAMDLMEAIFTDEAITPEVVVQWGELWGDFMVGAVLMAKIFKGSAFMYQQEMFLILVSDKVGKVHVPAYNAAKRLGVFDQFQAFAYAGVIREKVDAIFGPLQRSELRAEKAIAKKESWDIRLTKYLASLVFDLSVLFGVPVLGIPAIYDLGVSPAAVFFLLAGFAYFLYFTGRKLKLGERFSNIMVGLLSFVLTFGVVSFLHMKDVRDVQARQEVGISRTTTPEAPRPPPEIAPASIEKAAPVAPIRDIPEPNVIEAVKRVLQGEQSSIGKAALTDEQIDEYLRLIIDKNAKNFETRLIPLVKIVDAIVALIDSDKSPEYRENVRKLLTRTVVVESDQLRADEQYRGGPGAGVANVEVNIGDGSGTAEYLLTRILQRADWKAIVQRVFYDVDETTIRRFASSKDKSSRELREYLRTHPAASIFLARVKYRLFRSPIPFGENEQILYWAIYYNGSPKAKRAAKVDNFGAIIKAARAKVAGKSYPLSVTQPIEIDGIAVLPRDLEEFEVWRLVRQEIEKTSSLETSERSELRADQFRMLKRIIDWENVRHFLVSSLMTVLSLTMASAMIVRFGHHLGVPLLAVFVLAAGSGILLLGTNWFYRSGKRVFDIFTGYMLAVLAFGFVLVIDRQISRVAAGTVKEPSSIIIAPLDQAPLEAGAPADVTVVPQTPAVTKPFEIPLEVSPQEEQPLEEHVTALTPMDQNLRLQIDKNALDFETRLIPLVQIVDAVLALTDSEESPEYRENIQKLLTRTLVVESDQLQTDEFYGGEPGSAEYLLSRVLGREDWTAMAMPIFYDVDEVTLRWFASGQEASSRDFQEYLKVHPAAAVFLARIKYLLIPVPLPKGNNDQILYWANYYNSSPQAQSAARSDHFMGYIRAVRNVVANNTYLLKAAEPLVFDGGRRIIFTSELDEFTVWNLVARQIQKTKVPAVAGKSLGRSELRKPARAEPAITSDAAWIHEGRAHDYSEWMRVSEYEFLDAIRSKVNRKNEEKFAWYFNSGFDVIRALFTTNATQLIMSDQATFGEKVSEEGEEYQPLLRERVHASRVDEGGVHGILTMSFLGINIRTLFLMSLEELGVRDYTINRLELGRDRWTISFVWRHPEEGREKLRTVYFLGGEQIEELSSLPMELQKAIAENGGLDLTLEKAPNYYYEDIKRSPAPGEEFQGRREIYQVNSIKRDLLKRGGFAIGDIEKVREYPSSNNLLTSALADFALVSSLALWWKGIFFTWGNGGLEIAQRKSGEPMLRWAGDDAAGVNLRSEFRDEDLTGLRGEFAGWLDQKINNPVYRDLWLRLSNDAEITEILEDEDLNIQERIQEVVDVLDEDMLYNSIFAAGFRWFLVGSMTAMAGIVFLIRVAISWDEGNIPFALSCSVLTLMAAIAVTLSYQVIRSWRWRIELLIHHLQQFAIHQRYVDVPSVPVQAESKSQRSELRTGPNNLILRGSSPAMNVIASGEIVTWEREAKRVNFSLVRPFDTPREAAQKVENEVHALTNIWRRVLDESERQMSLGEQMQEVLGLLLEEAIYRVRHQESRSDEVLRQMLDEMKRELAEQTAPAPTTVYAMGFIQGSVIPALVNREDFIHLPDEDHNKKVREVLIQTAKDRLMTKVFDLFLNLPFGLNTDDSKLADGQKEASYTRRRMFADNTVYGMTIDEHGRPKTIKMDVFERLAYHLDKGKTPQKALQIIIDLLNAHIANFRNLPSGELFKRMIQVNEELRGYVESIQEDLDTYDYIFEMSDLEEEVQVKKEEEVRRHEEVMVDVLDQFLDAITASYEAEIQKRISAMVKKKEDEASIAAVDRTLHEEAHTNIEKWKAWVKRFDFQVRQDILKTGRSIEYLTALFYMRHFMDLRAQQTFENEAGVLERFWEGHKKIVLEMPLEGEVPAEMEFLPPGVVTQIRQWVGEEQQHAVEEILRMIFDEISRRVRENRQHAAEVFQNVLDEIRSGQWERIQPDDPFQAGIISYFQETMIPMFNAYADNRGGEGRRVNDVEPEALEFLMRYYDRARFGPTQQVDRDLVVFAKTIENERDLYHLLSSLRGHGRVVAIVSPGGTSLSHWVTFARDLGIVVIPAADFEAAGLEFSKETLQGWAMADGREGFVVLRPDYQTRDTWFARRESYADLDAFFLARADEPVFFAGREILFYVDDTKPEDFQRRAELRSIVERHGGKGVGLFRTEQLAAHPGWQGIENDRVRFAQTIQGILMQPFFQVRRPFIVRIFDVQMDKRPKILTEGRKPDEVRRILEIPLEEGRNRLGVRFYLDKEGTHPHYGDLFKQFREFGKMQLMVFFQAQVAAYNRLEELAREGKGPQPEVNLHILIPDIIDQRDINGILELIEEAKTEYLSGIVEEEQEKARQIINQILIGFMFEKENAMISPDADFYAVGSNDLMVSINQVGRDDPKAQKKLRQLHPNLVGKIAEVAASMNSKGKWVTVDGVWGGSRRLLLALLALRLIRPEIEVYQVAETNQVPEMLEFVRNTTPEEIESQIKPLVERILAGGEQMPSVDEFDQAVSRLQNTIQDRILQGNVFQRFKIARRQRPRSELREISDISSQVQAKSISPDAVQPVPEVERVPAEQPQRQQPYQQQPGLSETSQVSEVGGTVDISIGSRLRDSLNSFLGLTGTEKTVVLTGESDLSQYQNPQWKESQDIVFSILTKGTVVETNETDVAWLVLNPGGRFISIQEEPFTVSDLQAFKALKWSDVQRGTLLDDNRQYHYLVATKSFRGPGIPQTEEVRSELRQEMPIREVFDILYEKGLLRQNERFVVMGEKAASTFAEEYKRTAKPPAPRVMTLDALDQDIAGYPEKGIADFNEGGWNEASYREQFLRLFELVKSRPDMQQGVSVYLPLPERPQMSEGYRVSNPLWDAFEIFTEVLVGIAADSGVQIEYHLRNPLLPGIGKIEIMLPLASWQQIRLQKQGQSLLQAKPKPEPALKKLAVMKKPEGWDGTWTPEELYGTPMEPRSELRLTWVDSALTIARSLIPAEALAADFVLPDQSEVLSAVRPIVAHQIDGAELEQVLKRAVEIAVEELLSRQGFGTAFEDRPEVYSMTSKIAERAVRDLVTFMQQVADTYQGKVTLGLDIPELKDGISRLDRESAIGQYGDIIRSYFLRGELDRFAILGDKKAANALIQVLKSIPIPFTAASSPRQVTILNSGQNVLPVMEFSDEILMEQTAQVLPVGIRLTSEAKLESQVLGRMTQTAFAFASALMARTSTDAKNVQAELLKAVYLFRQMGEGPENQIIVFDSEGRPIVNVSAIDRLLRQEVQAALQIQKAA